MNVRINSDTDIPEIQVSVEEWRPIEEVVDESSQLDKSLRNYLKDRYGEIIE